MRLRELVGILTMFVGGSLALANGGITTATPSQGRFGTPVTITLSSPTSDCEFNGTTTMSWTGTYTPSIGPVTTPFTIDWSAAEVNVLDPGNAVIVMGGGTSLNAPNVDALNGLGTFTGAATLNTTINPPCPADFDANGSVDSADMANLLANWGPCPPPCDADLDGSGMVNSADLAILLAAFGACPSPSVFQVVQQFNFTLTSDATQWRTVFYPDGPGGLDPPELGPTRPDVDMLLVSQLPDPPPPVDMMMDAAHNFHMIAVVLVEENTQSLLSAPTTIVVDLVSLTALGKELDRASNVTLTRIDDDQDTVNITYRSDPALPVMMVDTVLDPLMYPGLMLLFGVNGGFAVIAPSFTN